MRRAAIILAIAAWAVPLPSRAALEYIKPVPGPIVRHFEPPPTPYAAGHRGIDIEAPAGTTVIASAGGVVAFAGQVGGSLFVSIDHPDGIRTTYSFLSAVLVRAREAVAQGAPVARSGPGHDDGTPPHLHFGMRIGDEYIDPEPFLVAGLRRNQSAALRLAPLEGGAPAAARGRVLGTAVPPLALVIALAARPRGWRRGKVRHGRAPTRPRRRTGPAPAGSTRAPRRPDGARG